MKTKKIALGFRPARLQIKALSDKLTFGKYKGRTIENIVMNHPSYFLWLVEEDVVDVLDDEFIWMAQLNDEDEKEKHYFSFPDPYDFLYGDRD